MTRIYIYNAYIVSERGINTIITEIYSRQKVIYAEFVSCPGFPISIDGVESPISIDDVESPISIDGVLESPMSIDDIDE